MLHSGLTRHHDAFRESTTSCSVETLSHGYAMELCLLVLFSISRNSVVCTDDAMLHVSAVTSPWRPTESATNCNFAVLSPKNQFCCWFSLVNFYTPISIVPSFHVLLALNKVLSIKLLCTLSLSLQKYVDLTV